MSPITRKSLTVEQKLCIIDKFEKGIKNKALCREYGVSHSTISSIIRHKALIKEQVTV